MYWYSKVEELLVCVVFFKTHILMIISQQFLSCPDRVTRLTSGDIFTHYLSSVTFLTADVLISLLL